MSATYHLIALGFPLEGSARASLLEIEDAVKNKEFKVADWALITKAEGGGTTIEKNKSVDPGAGRGGLVGGTAGLILAVASGPIGAGAVLGAAAIGAVTAGLRDSGLEDKKVKEISTLIADGRSLLLLAVPMEAKDEVTSFLEDNVVFSSSDRRYTVDIAPDHSLAEAIAAYRLHEED